jgi:hypothetical protein
MKLFKIDKNFYCQNCGQYHNPQERCIDTSIRKDVKEVKKIMSQEPERIEQEEIRLPKKKQPVPAETKYGYLEKSEISDENKNTFWQYKCKHCNSIILNVPMNVLNFIQEYEDEQEND